MPPYEYEELAIRGHEKDIRDKLRQAVMEGWQVYQTIGNARLDCNDEQMVRLVRPKQPALRKVNYYDPDNSLDRERHE